MNELDDFQTPQLVNLLAKETINYYKLIGYGVSVEESAQCNRRIKQIEIELEKRRNKKEKIIFQRQNTSEPVEYSY